MIRTILIRKRRIKMVEWSMELMMMMMVSRPKSNLQVSYTAGVPSTYDHQPIRSCIAKVYVLGTFRTKKTSDYRQGYSIPSYTMSPMTMMMVMISIGKAKQSFLPRIRIPRTKFPASREGKIESWGVCRCWEGYVT